jgi:hypothetical protein
MRYKNLHILTYQFKRNISVLYLSWQKDKKKFYEKLCRSFGEVSCLEDKEWMEGGIDGLVG